jgi:carbonic anhydrase/acetyltransferase-like protein (isoleucine patch superfamily)
MAVYALGDAVPLIDPGAWVHAQAVVIGNVTIGPEASIWPCAVLRGDFGRIEIGARSSVQDGTIVHSTEVHLTRVGDECVVGHNAYLEGCTLEDEVLVGSLAAVLPGCVVGRGAVIAAGAVVIGDTEVPDHALARGVPARIDEGAIESGRWSTGVQRYVDMAARYRRDLRLVEPSC